MSRVTRAYPFLLAFVPILYYAANNPDQYGMGDLLFLLAVTAGAPPSSSAAATTATSTRGRSPRSG